jgi:glycosyltransferase involved in cell wall biosynthesis
MTRANILYVVNKQLPANDYRINYPQMSQVADIWFGMPGRTETVAPDRYVRFDFKEGLRPRYFVEFVRLWRYLRHNRAQIDLVHFFSTNLMLFGPLIAFLAGKPSVVTVTGFGRTFNSDVWQMRLIRPIYNLLFSLTLHLARSVLFQNYAEMASTVQRWPRSREKLAYIGSAVSVIQNNAPKSFTVDPLQVVLVARLLPDKGIHDFLQVATAFRDRNDVEFVLIGPASLGYDALLAEVENTAKAGLIHYWGELNPEQTQAHLRAGHIFLFPSYGEGMARVMLEAGFALMCPIAYDIPANRDLVATDRGYLLATGDWQAATNTIRQLLENRNTLAANAHAYQQFIATTFTMQAYSERMDAILTQVIHDLNPAPSKHLN